MAKTRKSVNDSALRRKHAGVLAAGVVTAALIVGCGDNGGSTASAPANDSPAPITSSDPGPIHIHGLGINPRDAALFLATHTGLFRVTEGDAVRVADRFQDTMGFAVVGPDHFLGSGHPDGREDLPPFLGLIESSDGGETWDSVSLMGERDFHVLEESGGRIYGYGTDWETRRGDFMVSVDGGGSWDTRRAPGPLVSLAIDPDDPDHLLAGGVDGMYASRAGGDSWEPVSETPALVVWPPAGPIAVTASGEVLSADDSGGTWQTVGSIGGAPAAVESQGRTLLVALHNGTVKRSVDQGASWTVIWRPEG